MYQFSAKLLNKWRNWKKCSILAPKLPKNAQKMPKIKKTLYIEASYAKRHVCTDFKHYSSKNVKIEKKPNLGGKIAQKWPIMTYNDPKWPIYSQTCQHAKIHLISSRNATQKRGKSWYLEGCITQKRRGHFSSLNRLYLAHFSSHRDELYINRQRSVSSSKWAQ